MEGREVIVAATVFETMCLPSSPSLSSISPLFPSLPHRRLPLFSPVRGAVVALCVLSLCLGHIIVDDECFLSLSLPPRFVRFENQSNSSRDDSTKQQAHSPHINATHHHTLHESGESIRFVGSGSTLLHLGVLVRVVEACGFGGQGGRGMWRQ
jgi:hypothetical protein